MRPSAVPLILRTACVFCLVQKRYPTLEERQTEIGCRACMQSIGELLLALHYFAKTKLYPKDAEKLREVLTAENIKNFAEVLKTAKFSV
jgi:hypothetical protein